MRTSLKIVPSHMGLAMFCRSHHLAYTEAERDAVIRYFRGPCRPADFAALPPRLQALVTAYLK